MAKSLRALLPKKEKKNRFQAIWVWNASLDKEGIEKQLSQFHEKGFETVVIKPSREMKPEYLTEDFFELLNFTLETAYRLGVAIKLAESMVGGGDSFVARMANQTKSIRLETIRYCGETTLRTGKIFSKDVDVPDQELIFAVRVRNGELEPSSLKKLVSQVKNGRLSWRAPHGEWIVLAFSKQAQYLPLTGYQIDYYDPQVVSRYATDLYSTFKTEIEPKYWKRTFGGFVFDLPHIGPATKEIGWSQSFLAKFKSKFKQDFIRILPVLFHYSGKRTSPLRYQVYTFLQNLFDAVCLTQLVRLNRRYRLDNEYYASDVNPYYPDDSLRIIPFADKATCLNGMASGPTDATESPAVSRLLYRNLAFGKTTVRTILGRNSMSQSSTLQSLKLEVDKHVVWGGRYWTLDGMSYAPSPKNHPFVPNNPFIYSPSWQYMPRLLNYVRTITKVAESASPVRKVVVVYPRASLYGTYSISNQNEYNKIQSIVNGCVGMCARLGIECEVIEEEDLYSALWVKDKIRIACPQGKQDFDAVLLPRPVMVSKKTLRLAQKASTKKVPWYWLACFPTGTLEDGVQNTVRKSLEELHKKNPEIIRYFESLSGVEADLRVTIRAPLRVATADKVLEDVQLVQFSGRTQYFLLLNQSETNSRQAGFLAKGTGKMYLADCDKQELYRFPKAQQVDKAFQFDLELQPRQSCWLVTSRRALSTARGHLFEAISGLERKYRIVFKNKWNFKPEQPNVLPLTFWNMRISGSKDNSGFFRSYEAYVEVEEIPESLRLVLNGVINQPVEDMSPMRKHIEIAINGVKLKDFQGRFSYGESHWRPQNQHTVNPLFGPKALETEITGMLHKGFNRISVRSLGSYFAPQSIDYPLFITGSFALKRGSRGWILCNAATQQEYGSWADGGYQYYSGVGTYTQTFERPDAFKRLVVKFRKVEEIAVVKINGQLVSVFPFEPMEIDATNLTLQGRNEIAIQVLNTVDNMTRLNMRSSGLVGEVFLDVY